jgi:hypothetical protein
VPPFCEHLTTIASETIRCNGFGQGRTKTTYTHMCMDDTRDVRLGHRGGCMAPRTQFHCQCDEPMVEQETD